MEKYSKIFKTCPLFDGIEEEKLYKMLACLGAKVVHFDKKSEIFAEGEAAKSIGILLSGSAQTVRNDSYGNRSILALIEPPEIFGEDFACAEVGELPISVKKLLIACGAIFTSVFSIVSVLGGIFL